jgi:hypothetical protein
MPALRLRPAAPGADLLKGPARSTGIDYILLDIIAPLCQESQHVGWEQESDAAYPLGAKRRRRSKAAIAYGLNTDMKSTKRINPHSKTMRHLGAFSLAVAAMAWTTTASLVGHWPLDEGSGTAISDSSGQGNQGTLINAKAPHPPDPHRYRTVSSP